MKLKVIEFYETGEVRSVLKGEWYLHPETKGFHFWNHDSPTGTNFPIYKIWRYERMWKPSQDENYFIPNISTTGVFYMKFVWTNEEIDVTRLKHGLVCRTAEEAMELREKILNYTKNENNSRQLRQRRA